MESNLQPNFKNLTILHVEDEKMLADQFKFLVRRKFPKLIQAENGEEGIRKFISNRVDIIVTDINMPVMNGIDMAKRIRELNKKVQIIIFSALEKNSYLRDAINIGIDQFIDKRPGNNKELILALERSAREINLQKKIEEQRSSINKLSLAMEQSQTLVAIYDAEAKLEYANTKFYESFEYSQGELLGEHISKTKDSDFIKLFDKLKDNDSVDGEYNYITKSGNKIWVYSNLSVIRELGTVSNYLEITSIFTERKKFENELRIAKEQALEASKAKSTFLANMSHELRTPLNGILGITNLLLSSELNEKQINYLNLIKGTSEGFLRIINNILDFAKIEAGRLELEIKDYDLHDRLNVLMDVFWVSANQKGISLDLIIKDNLPRFVRGDSGRLAQIITNLVGNAIKFTEQGKIEVIAELDEQYEQYKPDNNKFRMRFYVKDTGIGIAEDKIDKLFNRFNQVDNSYTRKYGGTGLGLAISKELIRLMGGDIYVESKLNEGTTFTFEIIHEISNKDIRSQKTKTNNRIIKRKTSNQLDILVAEDNPINQTVLSEFLLKLEHVHTIANNGMEVIEKFKERKYDYLIIDIEMPKLNGLEAVDRIRKYERENGLQATPILALTANFGDDYKEEALKYGFDDFMSKPFDFQELQKKLEEISEQKAKKEILEPAKLNSLKRIFGNKPDMFNTIIRKFVEELPKQSRDLENAIKSEKYEDIRFISHKMKSAMANIEAENAVMMSNSIENNAKSKNLFAIKNTYEEFKPEIKRIRKYLSEQILIKNSENN